MNLKGKLPELKKPVFKKPDLKLTGVKLPSVLRKKGKPAPEDGGETPAADSGAASATAAAAASDISVTGGGAAVIDRPSTFQLEEELQRELFRKEYRRTIRSIIYIMLVVAAVSFLLVTVFFPVLRVTGSSMEPTLETGEIIIARKNSGFRSGDLVAFYYNNKVLLKRVIGVPGDMIEMDEEGNVYVNGQMLNEPYVYEKAVGDCDIEFPYQVPESRIFVMGDHRATSVDSRSKDVGCIPDERIIGKILFRIWPFDRISIVGRG